MQHAVFSCLPLCFAIAKTVMVSLLFHSFLCVCIQFAHTYDEVLSKSIENGNKKFAFVTYTFVCNSNCDYGISNEVENFVKNQFFSSPIPICMQKLFPPHGIRYFASKTIVSCFNTKWKVLERKNQCSDFLIKKLNRVDRVHLWTCYINKQVKRRKKWCYSIFLLSMLQEQFLTKSHQVARYTISCFAHFKLRWHEVNFSCWNLQLRNSACAALQFWPCSRCLQQMRIIETKQHDMEIDAELVGSETVFCCFSFFWACSSFRFKKKRNHWVIRTKIHGSNLISKTKQKRLHFMV